MNVVNVQQKSTKELADIRFMSRSLIFPRRLLILNLRV